MMTEFGLFLFVQDGFECPGGDVVLPASLEVFPEYVLDLFSR